MEAIEDGQTQIDSLTKTVDALTEKFQKEKSSRKKTVKRMHKLEEDLVGREMQLEELQKEGGGGGGGGGGANSAEAL